MLITNFEMNAVSCTVQEVRPESVHPNFTLPYATVNLYSCVHAPISEVSIISAAVKMSATPCITTTIPQHTFLTNTPLTRSSGTHAYKCSSNTPISRPNLLLRVVTLALRTFYPCIISSISLKFAGPNIPKSIPYPTPHTQDTS